MNNTGKRVDVARPIHDHENYFDNGVPVLTDGRFMDKQVVEYTPTCNECPSDGHEYRYDERGDQVCKHCGDIRNQSPKLCRHKYDSGRYDGFNTDNN